MAKHTKRNAPQKENSVVPSTSVIPLPLSLRQAEEEKKRAAKVLSAATTVELREQLAQFALTEKDVSVRVVRRNLWGRNEMCPCKSGKKYKKCCQGKLELTYVVNLSEAQAARRPKAENPVEEKPEEKKPEEITAEGNALPSSCTDV